jgi:hypothetical protein
MKISKFNIALLVLAVFMTYMTCRNFKETKLTDVPPPAAQNVETYSSKGYNLRASHVIDGSNPDTAGIFQIKKAPARVDVPWRQVAPEHQPPCFPVNRMVEACICLSGSDTTVHLNYVNKTLQFREDQTFDIIIKGKVAETGHWAMEEEKKILYLSCNDTYFNNTWRVQENGFRLVFIGNTDLNVTGIQIRLDGSKTPPSAQ